MAYVIYPKESFGVVLFTYKMGKHCVILFSKVSLTIALFNE